MNDQGTAQVQVRHARPGDLPEVARLAAEHAEYEKASPPPADLADRLSALLFGSAAPRLRVLVAELAPGELIGYASCAPEMSTWDGAEYMHMDCLFLRDGHRGLRVGPKLIEAVATEARSLGIDHVQWQTPPWNTDAIRFYNRLGATSKEKLRFTLPVD
ncbi:GNAT family N-acetyltransferase [Yinghuangia soli]|uniref:GNAT family N-acetyltransferase n=1 Tax=Yinghuangia soli TaxID=2908204 RepID=A0AA41PXJ2_9ACTN|nr:GNAT family N-acetyltransferase [Yinghuangia soli]MCF2527568.1 GNAT family N-acetyltransferase [Yinghuangia soli]